MKAKSYLIFGIVAIVLLVGTFFILEYTKEKATQNALRYSDTVEIRKTTFANCQNLLNKTINFEGKILFEECGKNCLGGCPGSGPDYCFYGIQDSDQCVVYLKSRYIGYGVFKDETFDDYDIGQTVKINGEISLYYSYYCKAVEGEGYVNQVPECSYLVIGDVF